MEYRVTTIFLSIRVKKMHYFWLYFPLWGVCFSASLSLSNFHYILPILPETTALKALGRLILCFSDILLAFLLLNGLSSIMDFYKYLRGQIQNRMLLTCASTVSETN